MTDRHPTQRSYVDAVLVFSVRPPHQIAVRLVVFESENMAEFVRDDDVEPDLSVDELREEKADVEIRSLCDTPDCSLEPYGVGDRPGRIIRRRFDRDARDNDTALRFEILRDNIESLKPVEGLVPDSNSRLDVASLIGQEPSVDPDEIRRLRDVDDPRCGAGGNEER